MAAYKMQKHLLNLSNHHLHTRAISRMLIGGGGGGGAFSCIHGMPDRFLFKLRKNSSGGTAIYEYLPPN